MKRSIFLLLFSLGIVLPSSAGPLHDAARNGDLNQIEKLIAQGADVNAPGPDGEAPLTIAALQGQREMVALLLKRGAELQLRNKGGLTPLHAAAYSGHREVVEFLISKGANLNDADNHYGVSPLHLAAEENRTAVVQLLLAKGANAETKEVNGYTPISRAGFREHWEVARLLIKHGAACQPAEKVGDWLYGECTKLKAQQ